MRYRRGAVGIALPRPPPWGTRSFRPHERGRSSGKSQRHRLDRGGNRQLNAALYRIAITQSRYPAARAYLERKQAEGKSRREAIRCLKRLLARTVFNAMKASPGSDIGATLAQTRLLAARLRGGRQLRHSRLTFKEARTSLGAQANGVEHSFERPEHAVQPRVAFVAGAETKSGAENSCAVGLAQRGDSV
jgi:hypothetical protein